LEGNLNSKERIELTIVGIIILIILVLLAIYLFQRVRAGGVR
jgi:flagellar biogenesis protein FliO